MLARLLALLVVSAIMAGCTSLPPADRTDDGSLRVASLNALYIHPSGSRYDAWIERRDTLITAIRKIDADVFALQEVETFDGRPFNEDNLLLQWLTDNLPEYGVAAIGAPEVFPSTQPILYRTDRLRLLEQGFYFFPGQDAPLHPRRADGRANRYAAWALFQPLNGATPIEIHNVHFDHRSGTRRQQAASTVADIVAPTIADGRPVLVLGDLNALSQSPTAAILRNAGLTFSKLSGATFHFGTGIGVFPAIDHLLFSDRFAPVGRGTIFRLNDNGQLPSDHHPVVQDLRLD